MILNKMDLLPYVNFDVEKCIGYALKINPNLKILKLSAMTGENLQAWIEWIESGLEGLRQQRAETVAGLKQRIAELEARLSTHH